MKARSRWNATKPKNCPFVSVSSTPLRSRSVRPNDRLRPTTAGATISRRHNRPRVNPMPLDDAGRHSLARNKGDWRSYDEIAGRYDQVWSTRFEPVARHIWTLLSPRVNERVLDVGTGTGIVPMSLSEAIRASVLAVGCDRAAGMLSRARARVAGLRVLVAEATALPFRSESFQIVTASFVLSHIPDYRRALLEVFGVLKPLGQLAVSNWAPPSDPHSSAWSECLAGAISKAEAERALAEVAPWESHFSQPGHLEAARSTSSGVVAS